LYRKYYRENNSLYYKDSRKPKDPRVRSHTHPQSVKATPKPASSIRSVKDGKTPPPAEDPSVKDGVVTAPRK
jgi:hypothetical protein